jgi:hypothetical protein
VDVMTWRVVMRNEAAERTAQKLPVTTAGFWTACNTVSAKDQLEAACADSCTTTDSKLDVVRQVEFQATVGRYDNLCTS